MNSVQFSSVDALMSELVKYHVVGGVRGGRTPRCLHFLFSHDALSTTSLSAYCICPKGKSKGAESFRFSYLSPVITTDSSLSCLVPCCVDLLFSVLLQSCNRTLSDVLCGEWGREERGARCQSTRPADPSHSLAAH